MKRVVLLVFSIILCGIPVVKAQSLNAGDIAIIGANAVNPDEFAFVALVDIPQGTVIGFVDHGWLASGSFRINEDELFYTASGTISKGTVINIDTNAGAPRFSQTGDQLLAFQGSIGSPTFIYALNFEGNGEWQSDATSSNTSALPTGLVNGSTAVAVAECNLNNHKYNGPTTGSKNELLGHIGDKSNWTCTGSRQVFLSAFTVTDAGGNSIPEFVSPILTVDAVAGDQVQIQYSATDADSDPLVFGGIGLPSGASVDPSSGVFSWIPSEGDVGSNVFTITVFDGTDTTSISVTIDVTSAVQARTPRFTSLPADTLVAGGIPLLLPFVVEDPEGLPIATYSIQPSNLGANITNDSFDWRTSTTPNIYKFTVTATDAEGLSVSHDLFIGVSGTLFLGDAGVTLLTSLQNAYSPDQTLGYNVARDTMYAKIDLDPDGFVRGIYTGFPVEYTGGDPSTQMFNNGINAEHTWPQSMGAGDEPQRSDLHFLFPAKDNVNSTRSNHPYAEIPDIETSTWFTGSTSQSTIPSVDIDSYSEFASGRFEPRESVKGDVSRAVFYFNTIYESVANEAFFALQSSTLIDWETTDPVSGKEIRRSGLIGEYQGNINPFLLDDTLDDRLFGTATNVGDGEIPIVFGIDSVYPNPTFKSIKVEINAPRFVGATMSIHNVLGERILSRRLNLSRGTSHVEVDLKNVASGVYFVSVSSEIGTTTHSILKY